MLQQVKKEMEAKIAIMEKSVDQGTTKNLIPLFGKRSTVQVPVGYKHEQKEEH